MKARASFLGARTSIQNVRAFPMYKTLGKLLTAINTPVNALWFRTGVGSFSSARFFPTGSLPVPNSFLFFLGRSGRDISRNICCSTLTPSPLFEKTSAEKRSHLCAKQKKSATGMLPIKAEQDVFGKIWSRFFRKYCCSALLGNFSVVKKTSAEKRAQQYSYLCSKPKGLMYGNLHRE